MLLHERDDLGALISQMDTPRERSAVLFAPSAEAPARALGKRLDIQNVAPIDPGLQALVGNSPIAVLVGSDQAR